MNQVSDPTLVFARHLRVKTHGCVCGWTAHDVTHADHLIRELGNSGFVLVDVAHLLGALTQLGIDVAQAPARRARLGAIADVALECGVSRSAASMWASRAHKLNFPAPYTTLATGNVYDLDEVKEWYRVYRSTRNGAHV